MEHNANKFLSVTIIIFFLAGCVDTDPATHGIEGAWKIETYHVSAPDTSYGTDSAQPGLVLFTDGYYSMVYVPMASPRKLFTDSTTDADQLEAYRSFVANSGTYQVQNDSVLTATPIVSKNPNFMGQGQGVYHYRVGSDHLTLDLQDPVVDETMVLSRAFVKQ